MRALDSVILILPASALFSSLSYLACFLLTHSASQLSARNFLFVQSSSTKRAEHSDSKIVSPQPMTAGRPNSAARMAMCEAAPPYCVTSPAMVWPKIQS
jgi:hypothetical protein